METKIEQQKYLNNPKEYKKREKAECEANVSN